MNGDEVRREVEHLIVLYLGAIKERMNGIDRVISERDVRYAERFDAAEDAVKIALKEARDQAEKAVTSQKEAVDAAFDASEQAILKAENAITQKADVTFVKLEKVQDMMSNLMRREDAEQRFTDHLERIAAISTRITQMESVKTGASDLTKMAIGVGSLIILFLMFLATRGGL